LAEGTSRKGLRLFGIPIRLGASIWTFAILAFWIASGSSYLWPFLAVVGVVVIVHELGHAIEIRRVGGEPEITFEVLGGHTTGMPPGVSAWRNIWISAAGIVYSLVFLAVVAGVSYLVGDSMPPVVVSVLAAMVILNAVWAVIQLLPIGTADGSHILESIYGLLKVRHIQHWMIASVVVTALAVAPFAYQWGYLAVAYLAYLTFTDVRQRLAIIRFETDHVEDWKAEIDKLWAAGRYDEGIGRLEEIETEAKSANYRNWAIESRMERLSRLGRHTEALALSEQHPEIGDVWSRVRLYTAANDLAGVLSTLTAATHESVDDMLTGTPNLRSILFGVAADMPGSPTPAWEIIKPFARQLDYVGYMAAWWGARISRNAWVAAALDEVPVPPIGDEAVYELQAYRDRQSRSLRELADLVGTANSMTRRAVLATLYRDDQTETILATALRPSPILVVSLSELQVVLFRDGQFPNSIEVGRRLISFGLDPRSAGMARINLACAHLGLGDPDGALGQLEQVPPGMLGVLGDDEDLAGLRGHPRFEALLSSRTA
jgi:Zn-dependent protease